MPARGMATQTRVASANVLHSLGSDEARCAIADVLALEPDLVGLQEWYVPRTGLLRETGAEPPYALYLVTADPAEGEGMTAAGSNIVEPVPMPKSTPPSCGC